MKSLFTPFFEYAEQRIKNLDDKSQEILNNDGNSSFNDVLIIAKQMVDIREYIEAYQQILAFTERYPFVFFDQEGIEIARPITEALGLDEIDLQKLRKIKSLEYIVNSWELEDGDLMAKNNPYIYYKPSREITKYLEIGNLVKLKFLFKKLGISQDIPKAEKMWLKITNIDSEHENYEGKLVNTPFWILDLFYGDKIKFAHKHILDHDMHRHEDNLVDKYAARCMVNKAIIFEDAPINHFRHDVPIDVNKSKSSIDRQLDIELGKTELAPDSGWSFYTGEESEEYLKNDNNFVMVSLASVLRRDDSFIDYLQFGVGHAFARDERGDFISVEFGIS